MKKLIAQVLLLTLINTSVSKAEDKAADLVKGDPAPFSGTLLPPKMAKEAIEAKIENTGLKKETESLNKSITLYKSNEEILNKKSDMLLNQNIELTKTLNDTRSTSNWEKIGWTVLGVAIAGLGVYGASKLGK